MKINWNKIKICLVLMGMPFIIYSQNLVPNPSFEYYSKCPDWGSQIYYAEPWFQPNLNTTNSNSDLYNECGENIFVAVPKNIGGYQYARTGLGYSGIGVLDRNYSLHSMAREYIEVKLIDTLVKSLKYNISFFVSRANKTNYAIDALGVYVSKDSVVNNDYFGYPLPYIPQIQNPLGNVLKDTLNWVEISGEYTAQGGERFITIGNFLYDSLLTIETFGTSPSSNWGYYYIDDVSVIENTGVGYKDVSGSNSKVSVYPNPSSGEVLVDASIQEASGGRLEMFDVFGKLKETYFLNAGKNFMRIDGDKLKGGVYVFKVYNGTKVIKHEKLIIIK